jgi:hypothetical protein
MEKGMEPVFWQHFYEFLGIGLNGAEKRPHMRAGEPVFSVTSPAWT